MKADSTKGKRKRKRPSKEAASRYSVNFDAMTKRADAKPVFPMNDKSVVSIPLPAMPMAAGIRPLFLSKCLTAQRSHLGSYVSPMLLWLEGIGVNDSKVLFLLYCCTHFSASYMVDVGSPDPHQAVFMARNLQDLSRMIRFSKTRCVDRDGRIDRDVVRDVKEIDHVHGYQVVHLRGAMNFAGPRICSNTQRFNAAEKNVIGFGRQQSEVYNFAGVEQLVGMRTQIFNLSSFQFSIDVLSVVDCQIRFESVKGVYEHRGIDEHVVTGIEELKAGRLSVEMQVPVSERSEVGESKGKERMGALAMVYRAEHGGVPSKSFMPVDIIENIGREKKHAWDGPPIGELVKEDFQVQSAEQLGELNVAPNMIPPTTVPLVTGVTTLAPLAAVGSFN